LQLAFFDIAEPIHAYGSIIGGPLVFACSASDIHGLTGIAGIDAAFHGLKGIVDIDAALHAL